MGGLFIKFGWVTILVSVVYAPARAAICFLPDCEDKLAGDVHGENIQDGYCKDDGFIRYPTGSCPQYSYQEVCVYNSQYLKCNQQKWCSDNGYTYTSCVVPEYLEEKCLNGLEMYKRCKLDYPKACEAENPEFTNVCPSGWQIDPSNMCSYTPTFGKCCNQCSGFDYLASSIPTGYVKGESCTACGGITKYKAEINNCEGYRSCSNGGKTGTATCMHGGDKWYKECCNECSDYPYTESNIPAGYVKGASCDSCWGTRYKASANPCSGYKTCPAGEGVASSGTCLSGSTLMYISCCANSCSLSTCPVGTTCTKETCSGKYCATGCQVNYTWQNGICNKQEECTVGKILYSDRSCSSEPISGKTSIAIVSYINGSKRLAIQLTNPGTMLWSNGYTDLSGITNYSSSPHTTDFSGKSNTAAWVSYYGSNITNYAPGYCYNYTTAGTVKGDWYLPAQGELYASIWTNKSKVNSGLGKVSGGATLIDGWHWSSSELTSYGYGAWRVNAGNGEAGAGTKYDGSYVRCVLAF